MSGPGRFVYGATRYACAVVLSWKKSWPVCTTEPPTCTFTWMCTARPWYQPGYTVRNVASPFRSVGWMPRMNVRLDVSALKPE